MAIVPWFLSSDLRNYLWPSLNNIWRRENAGRKWRGEVLASDDGHEAVLPKGRVKGLVRKEMQSKNNWKDGTVHVK